MEFSTLLDRTSPYYIVSVENQKKNYGLKTVFRQTNSFFLILCFTQIRHQCVWKIPYCFIWNLPFLDKKIFQHLLFLGDLFLDQDIKLFEFTDIQKYSTYNDGPESREFCRFYTSSSSRDLDGFDSSIFWSTGITNWLTDVKRYLSVISRTLNLYIFLLRFVMEAF